MINTTMKSYNYFTYGKEDSYGQAQLSAEPQGKIKIAINLSSQTIQDNINYKGCQYVGLTHDKTVNDSYVIQYGESKLKVLYVNPMGRFTQVFMAEQ